MLFLPVQPFFHKTYQRSSISLGSYQHEGEAMCCRSHTCEIQQCCVNRDYEESLPDSDFTDHILQNKSEDETSGNKRSAAETYTAAPQHSLRNEYLHMVAHESRISHACEIVWF